MNHRTCVLLLTLAALAMLALPHPAGGRPSAPQRVMRPEDTVITVNSGGDPDASEGKSCLNATPCTLRRAIVQANGLPAGQRPVFIRFDIPPTPGDGYDGDLGVWIIALQAGAGTAVLPPLQGGLITIDGESQPGGRELGPRIIVRGPGAGEQDGFLLGRAGAPAGVDDGNELIGLATQNLRNHVVAQSNSNLIYLNWFGLDAAGTAPYLRGGDAARGSGATGVLFGEGTAANSAIGNIILGQREDGARLGGSGGLFAENLVGTDGEGAVRLKPANPQKQCTAEDWLGGAGVRVGGSGHVIADNAIAGQRIEGAAQPDALHISGAGHLVENNLIGVDFLANEVGVCGGGLRLAGGPQQILVSRNRVANPQRSAITLEGAAYDANELRGNLVSRARPWPDGESALRLDPSLPQALRDFSPAQIEEIEGQVVRGGSAPGSPCPNCTIELFLDDADGIAETLESLAVVTADADGSWLVTLPRILQPGEGLRLTSTAEEAGVVTGLGAPLTSRLSGFTAGPQPPYYLPVIRAQ